LLALIPFESLFLSISANIIQNTPIYNCTHFALSQMKGPISLKNADSALSTFTCWAESNSKWITSHNRKFRWVVA